MTLLVHHLRLRALNLHFRLVVIRHLLVQPVQSPRGTRRLDGRIASIGVMLRRVASLACRGVALTGSVFVLSRVLGFVVAGPI